VSKQYRIDARHEDVDSRQQAISDCLYAKSLGNIALMQHIRIWDNNWATVSEIDKPYADAILEISEKLGTPECLLEN
jgi:hypothetical protein